MYLLVLFTSFEFHQEPFLFQICLKELYVHLEILHESQFAYQIRHEEGIDLLPILFNVILPCGQVKRLSDGIFA